MKYLVFLLLALAAGCKSNQSTENVSDQTHADSLSTLQNPDTLVMNNQVYHLDSISESDFKSLDKPARPDFENEIIDDPEHVRRDSLKLVFRLTNGADSVLMNDTTEDYSDYVLYNYMQSLREIDYWLIGTDYYEGSGYLLLDKENGEKIWIWGEPVFSPDKKHFVCYSFDMEAQYNPNGFQLFDIENKKAIHRWSKDIYDWGPSDIRWKNDSTLYIEQLKISFELNVPDKYSYKAMVVK